VNGSPRIFFDRLYENGNKTPSVSVFISSDRSNAQGNATSPLLLSAIQYLETLVSHILVCAVPNPGHVGPMLAAAQHLKSVGHNVTFHTSENFRGKAESTGIRFVALTGKANYDYRRPSDLPDYENYRIQSRKSIC